MVNEDNEHDNESSVSYTDSYGDGEVKEGKVDTERHSRDAEIHDPVDDVEELAKRFLMEKALRDANQPTPQDFENRSEERERLIELFFSLRVIKYAREALEAEDLDPNSNDVSIEPSFVLALLLREVRLCGLRELSDYLEDYPKVRKALGLEKAYGKSAFSRRNTELLDAQRTALENAAIRVLYVVYHRGHPFPQEVWRAHAENGPAISPIRLDEELTEYDIDIEWELRVEAVRNWASLFLDSGIVEALSFDRDSNAEYPMEAFLGLLAQAASQHDTVAGATKSCRGYEAPVSVVPWGSGLQIHVNNLSMTEISEMLWEANQAFLALASEFIPISQPLRYAFDLTDVPLNPDREGDIWSKGYAHSLIGIVEPAEEDERWSYGIVGVMEADARFALGILPVETGKGVHAAALARLLRPPVSESDVNPKLVVMDRQMVGAKMVTRLRELVGPRWMMNGKKFHELARLVEKTPEDEIAFYENIDFLQELNEKPNAFVMPISEEEERASDSQRIILTDLTPAEVDWDYLNFSYKHRYRIENTIDQVKNHFEIKLNRSGDAKLKYFYLGVQMLFFNLHNLINNSLSPKYMLPLGNEKDTVTTKEVLGAVRDEMFKRAAEKMGEPSR